jgi:hypothetical protein
MHMPRATPRPPSRTWPPPCFTTPPNRRCRPSSSRGDRQRSVVLLCRRDRGPDEIAKAARESPCHVCKRPPEADDDGLAALEEGVLASIAARGHPSRRSSRRELKYREVSRASRHTWETSNRVTAASSSWFCLLRAASADGFAVITALAVVPARTRAHRLAARSLTPCPLTTTHPRGEPHLGCARNL